MKTEIRLAAVLGEVKAKHSPGPWHVETVKTQIGICHKIGPFPGGLRQVDGGYACVYVDGAIMGHPNSYENELLANARLMASSPDMASALQAFLELATGARCIQSVKWTSARDNARAALTKAGL